MIKCSTSMRYLPYALLVVVLGAGCSDQGTARTDIAVADVQVQTSGGSVTITPLVETTVAAAPVEDVDVVTENVMLDVAVQADNFSFSPSTITAKPGQAVRLTFTVDGEHTFAIDELDIERSITNGSSIDVVAPETPGKYRYYCSVGSHAALGMEGVLIVE